MQVIRSPAKVAWWLQHNGITIAVRGTKQACLDLQATLTKKYGVQ